MNEIVNRLENDMRTWMWVAAYLAAVVTANLLVAALGPGISVVDAFLLVGATMTVRDKLHDAWQRHRLRNMALLIATGSILSYALNRNAGPVAIASFAAFASAETVDALVYQLVHRWPWMERANTSNIASAAVDSLVFVLLAFGPMFAIVGLQILAKIAGGLVWSLILRPRRLRVGDLEVAR